MVHEPPGEHEPMGVGMRLRGTRQKKLAGLHPRQHLGPEEGQEEEAEGLLPSWQRFATRGWYAP